MTRFSEHRLISRRGTAGFTLTEMLVTTLILVLASTLLATGIPVAIDTYQRVVKTSNAQLALSTTISALRSEVGLATDVVVSGDKIYYFNQSDGCWESIGNASADSETRGLVKSYYLGLPTPTTPVEDLDEDGEPVPLVSDEAISTTNKSDAIKVALVSPKRTSNAAVDLQLIVSDVAGNQLAGVGTDDEPFRVLTRFTE